MKIKLDTELAKMKIDPKDLVNAFGITLEAAQLLAGAPKMLAFVLSFLRRPNAPAGIDVARVLHNIGFELEQASPRDAPLPSD